MKNTDDIVSGPILRSIVRLSVPVMLGMFMEFALAVTDLFWVGKLGAAAQDAITSSMVVIWTVFATAAIISIGITALVSRYIGAKQPDRATYYTRQGIILAVFVSLLITVPGYYGTKAVLQFMGTSALTLNMAVPYLRIFFLSSIFSCLRKLPMLHFEQRGIPERQW